MNTLIISRTLQSLALVASVSSFAGQYIDNAISVTSDTGEPLLMNRDVECITIEKSQTIPQTTAVIKIDAVSRRYFQDFTRSHLGKELSLSVCGVVSKKLKIQSVISTGSFLLGSLSPEQEKCLKDSFQIAKSCSDCPVCRN
ncbi:MAG: hypothetical protein ABIR96_12710 [Bdellovibrionota bacterium]